MSFKVELIYAAFVSQIDAVHGIISSHYGVTKNCGAYFPCDGPTVESCLDSEDLVTHFLLVCIPHLQVLYLYICHQHPP